MKNSWDDFMIKTYEEAWAYIRYTYDVSNTMLWYSFLIITVIGTITSRILIVGDGIQKPIEIRNPTLMTLEETNMLGFIFLVLFIVGLFIHAFYTFQRVIIDRQIRIIDHVDNYFIEQAGPKVELERFLYLKNIPIKRGTGDLVAQTRLALPLLINCVTGDLALMMFFRIWWRDIGCVLLIFFSIALFQFILINTIGYRFLAKRVTPEIPIKAKRQDTPAYRLTAVSRVERQKDRKENS